MRCLRSVLSRLLRRRCLLEWCVHLLSRPENVVDVKSLVWIGIQTRRNNWLQLTGIDVWRQWRVVGFLYLLTQGVQTHFLAVKRRSESCHFVKKTSQRPDVGLEIVSRFVNPFRRHVIRRSHQAVGVIRARTEEAAWEKLALITSVII